MPIHVNDSTIQHCSSLICGELKFILSAVGVSCVLEQTDCRNEVYVQVVVCMRVYNRCTSSSDVDSECCPWESSSSSSLRCTDVLCVEGPGCWSSVSVTGMSVCACPWCGDASGACMWWLWLLGFWGKLFQRLLLRCGVFAARLIHPSCLCCIPYLASSHSYHARMQRLLPPPGTMRGSCAVRGNTLICHSLVANYTGIASRWEACRKTSRRAAIEYLHI